MTDVTDNFNRANGPLGSNWIVSPYDATHQITISGNQVIGNTSSSNWVPSYWSNSVNTFSNDQYSQATAVGSTGNNSYGVVVRHGTAGVSNFYAFLTAGFDVYLFRYAGGTPTLLTSVNRGVAITAGDLLRLEIVGNTLTAKVNGTTVLTATDSAYASGQPGIIPFSINDIMDNWLGGPIVSGPTVVSGGVNADGISSASFTGKEISSSRINADGVSSVTFVAPSQIDPNWWKRFQANGVLPTAILDFENGLYYDGSNPNAAVSSMVGGSPTIDSSGLLCNKTTITGIGGLLTGIQGGTFSIALSCVGGTNGVNSGVFSMNLGDGPVFQQSDTKPNDFLYHGPSGFTDLTLAGGIDWTKRNRIISRSTVSGNARVFNGDISILNASDWSVTDANPFAANPTSIQLGHFIDSVGAIGPFGPFGGHICNLAVTTGLWDKVFGVMPPAFTGTNGLYFTGYGTGTGVTYGNILQYEYTQPYTIITAVCCTGPPASAGVIFTTSNGAPYPGYELWVDPSGKLRVRLIHDFGVNQYLGVIGSTNLIDRKWHVVACTYDGSGLASGIKLYVDGVLETNTVEIDNLGGRTIISPSNSYCIGNQLNGTSNPADAGGNNEFVGGIGLFRQFNTIKSLAYIQSYKINNIIQTVDATCVLAPNLNEGGSSLTTSDLSANGFVGTLSSTSLWMRGVSPVVLTVVSGAANADGVSSVSFIGKEISSTTLNVDGVSSAAFTGSAVKSSVLNADGVSSVAFIGKEVTSALCQADGVSSVSVTGSAIKSTVFNADGVSSVQWISIAGRLGLANMNGIADVAFDSLSRFLITARMDGTSDVFFIPVQQIVAHSNMDGLATVAFYSTGSARDATKILKYLEVPRVDYMTIFDWTPIADGIDVDIGIELRIGGSSILISYTPSINTPPDDTYIQNVYTSGNIFITTEHQVIWIKPTSFYVSTTVNGEITYDIPQLPPAPPVTMMGLPWRLG